MEKKLKRLAPNQITELSQCEIFVFGSNLEGQHMGGAARYAYDHFGITVPMLYYQNHEPFRYCNDADKNTLCSDCGVEITVNLFEDEFTKKELRKLIRQLDAAIISFYKEKGIHLLHEDD